jgi:GntR family transcriptional regulator, vanillate catabolism transcriptional regulator
MIQEERSSTHAQRALTVLRKRILGGDLVGGTRLYEVALAEELGISRTPVRDALSRLAAEALLDRAAGGGFVVRSFAVHDVVDTIELRGVLEGTAARLAAERGAPETLMAEARDAVQQIDRLFLGQEFDMEGYSRLNARFHSLLARMPQSDVLLREIERITALPFASPSAFLDDQSHQTALKKSLSVPQEQHHAILDAIAHREGFRAESLAREHARAARRNVEFLLSHEAAMREGVAGLAILSA